MNYRLVRQFSINMVDNVFRFFYKIIDFGKVWIDVFWAFYEIWEAFFLIFYNLFMYVYYFIIFIIDKLTESEAMLLFWRKAPKIIPYNPGSVYDRHAPNPIPAMYGKQAATAVKQTAEAAAIATRNVLENSANRLRKPASGGRVSIVRKLLEFFNGVFSVLKAIVVFPFKKLAGVFSHRLRPIKEDEIPRSHSLIEDYMKEYEQRRKG